MDSESLYNVLEREVVPLFYQRNEIEIPERWIYKMKKSIQMAGEKFSAQRMLMDYAKQFYAPAIGAAPLTGVWQRARPSLRWSGRYRTSQPTR